MTLQDNELCPLISVIVPVYNAEKFLPQAISSVINQTYSNFELLLINDGSTDGSLGVCRSFALKDSRIKVFDGPNRGVSAARNIGLDNAAGDYIAFLDADDVYEPSALQSMLHMLVKTDCDVVSCEISSLIDADNNEKPIAAKDYGVEILSTHDLLKRIFQGRSMASIWSKMYKRDFIGGHRMPVGVSLGEDVMFDTNLFSMSDAKACRYNNPMYKYRVLGDSVSHGSRQYEKSHQFIERLYAFWKENRQGIKETSFYPDLCRLLCSSIVRSPLLQSMRHREKREDYAEMLRDILPDVPKKSKAFRIYKNSKGEFYYLALNGLRFNMAYSAISAIEKIGDLKDAAVKRFKSVFHAK